MPEVAVPYSGGEDEIVIGHRHMLAVGVTGEHAALLLIHARDFAHDHGRVFLFPQYSADRGTDLRGTERRACHLIKQRLKNVVIRTVDQNVLRWRLAQRLRRSTSANASPTNYNPCPPTVNLVTLPFHTDPSV